MLTELQPPSEAEAAMLRTDTNCHAEADLCKLTYLTGSHRATTQNTDHVQAVPDTTVSPTVKPQYEDGSNNWTARGSATIVLALVHLWGLLV